MRSVIGEERTSDGVRTKLFSNVYFTKFHSVIRARSGRKGRREAGKALQSLDNFLKPGKMLKRRKIVKNMKWVNDGSMLQCFETPRMVLEVVQTPSSKRWVLLWPVLNWPDLPLYSNLFKALVQYAIFIHFIIYSCFVVRFQQLFFYGALFNVFFRDLWPELTWRPVCVVFCFLFHHSVGENTESCLVSDFSNCVSYVVSGNVSRDLWPLLTIVTSLGYLLYIQSCFVTSLCSAVSFK